MPWVTLMKFDFRNIWIPEAPEDPADLLTRPEVRGRNFHVAPSASKVTLLEILAPGDALVEHQPLSAWLVRMLATVLFGNSEGPFPSTSRDHRNIARHQLRRDFPLPGDCTYGEFHAETSQECMLICRREGPWKCFRVIITFPAQIGNNLPGAWAAPFFPMMLDLVRQAACDFLNRPGLPVLRELDMHAYVVLSLRNYNRGALLVPHGCRKRCGDHHIWPGFRALFLDTLPVRESAVPLRTVHACLHGKARAPPEILRNLGWQGAGALPVCGLPSGMGETERCLCSSLW